MLSFNAQLIADLSPWMLAIESKHFDLEIKIKKEKTLNSKVLASTC